MSSRPRDEHHLSLIITELLILYRKFALREVKFLLDHAYICHTKRFVLGADMATPQFAMATP